MPPEGEAMELKTTEERIKRALDRVEFQLTNTAKQRIDLRQTVEDMADDIRTLTAALKRADQCIADGQDCTSESQFSKWRLNAFDMRPHGDLIAALSPAATEATNKEQE
jgi:predicted  nucleic acid-binding Zn-ribbon protein